MKRVTYPPGDEELVMWTLPRGHFYDSWALTPTCTSVDHLLNGRVLPSLTKNTSHDLQRHRRTCRPQRTVTPGANQSTYAISSTALTPDESEAGSTSQAPDDTLSRSSGSSTKRRRLQRVRVTKTCTQILRLWKQTKRSDTLPVTQRRTRSRLKQHPLS